MTVNVLGWSHASAVALVDGVRVRVRRKRDAVWWMCDDCGRARAPHCPHTDALAVTPADPTKSRTTHRKETR